MAFPLALMVISSVCGCESTQQAGSGDMSGADREQTHLGAIAGPSLYDYAVGVLEQAASSDHPQLRANAIEALEVRPDLLEPYARNGLVDENRAVRFVAAMTIGRAKLVQLAPLVEPLLHDESQSVQAAAIFALKRCGHRVDLNPLAGMLAGDDPEVRANAGMILGEIGEPSAAPLIESCLGRGMELAGPAKTRIVDIQLAEALVRLGRQEQIDSIRAALFLPVEQQGEITALACVILGRLQDGGAVGGLRALVDAGDDLRKPAEIRMAAATGLAMMGQPVPAGIAAEYANEPQIELRYQAASALGYIGGADSVRLLQRMLQDGSPLVRVAAAAALLRIEESRS